MPNAETGGADAVFAELNVVNRALHRLQQTLPFNLPFKPGTDIKDLVLAHGDLTGALAQAAWWEFPKDARRWDAGCMLLETQQRAIGVRAMGAGVPRDAWSALLADVEAAILDAPEAPRSAQYVAFQCAVRRTVGQLNTEADLPATVRSLDSLSAKMSQRLSGPLLEGALQLSRGSLLARLEELDMRSELRARLNDLAKSEDAETRAAAEGRLRLLDARETPLDLVIEDISGKRWDLAKLRGQVVFLEFWATHCGPCRDEIPHLRSVHAAFKDRGFQIIGLSLDRSDPGETDADTRARVVAFMKENGVDWPTQFDNSGWDNSFHKMFAMAGIPRSLLLDRTGRLVALDPRGDDLAVQVERLLA